MVRKLLGRLFLKETEPAPDVDMPPAIADQPFVAVGDVHGRIDLLDRMLAQLDASHRDAQIVMVGDYIDRGEGSADVLRRLHLASAGAGGRVICLMGNHEEMVLKFLDDPEAHGTMWLRNGGLQTLASFGIGGIAPSAKGAPLRRARDQLALKMGDAQIDWLRNLPLSWQSGNIVVAHAGADPSRPITDQPGSSLVWGHRDFGRLQRTDGLWIVHGHTIVPEPIVRPGQIAIDTGAYATGRLTGVVFRTGDMRFVTA